MNYRTGQKVGILFAIIGPIVAYLTAPLGAGIAMYICIGIGCLVFLIGIIIYLLFYKYPHCGHSLVNNKGKITYCPYCSKELK